MGEEVLKGLLLSRRARRVAACVLAAACWLAAAPAAFGQITLDQNFDGGSLKVDECTITYNNPSMPTVTLVPRRTWDATWHEQDRVFFKATGVNGLNPRFQLPLFGDSRMHPDQWHMYSYDQVNWQFFDINFQTTSPWVHNWGNNSPFTQDEVFIAYALPYPVSMTAAHTNSIKTSPWVSPTASADANLIIGRTLGTARGGYTDELGRTIPSLPLWGYKVTDPSATGQKARIVLTAGNHPEETVAHYAMQGIVDFYLSNDPRAAMLRKFTELYVYPQNNPEGRWAGYKRTNPEKPFSPDHNRWWHDPAGRTDITIVENAMKADTGGHVEYFFDFHVMGFPDYVDLWPFPGESNSPFVLSLKELEPELQTTQEWGEPRSAQGWAKSVNGLSADYSYTAEFGSLNGALQDRYYLYGENYALALFDAIIPADVIGDADGDGYVDDDDLSLFLTNWGVGTEWGQGDFTNDGTVDDDDLNILLTNWHTGTSPLGVPDSIPEPAIMSFMVIGAASMLRRRRG